MDVDALAEQDEADEGEQDWKEVTAFHVGLHRHCERSEAIQSFSVALDCFVASLLAMTVFQRKVARAARGDGRPRALCRRKWGASSNSRVSARRRDAGDRVT